MNKKISILLPVLNESGNIGKIVSLLTDIFLQLPQYDFEIIFVDDGSSDSTLNEIISVSVITPNVFYISFSRNFGKDSALLAGLKLCNGDAVITMDADLQHPPAMIIKLIQEWENGFEIVYCYRAEKNRNRGVVSQLSSYVFYKIVNLLSEIKLENGLSDFRLMNKKALDALLLIPENNPFLRGLVKWIGFKQLGIPYTPETRNAGHSSYNMKSLMRLASHGITSFSTKPLTLAIYLGFLFSFTSILYIPYAIISKLLGYAVSGWASVIVTIAFFGGINLLIMGIIGIYLGKTFMQGKQRPHYIISDTNLPVKIISA